jgi:hypothetical protein
MFTVTYLGHQGWLVSGKASRILIDPLLTDEYSPGFQAVIYPPRKLEFSKFPPIDALETFLEGTREARGLSEKLGDSDTFDLLTGIISEFEKHAWFLRASLD